MSIRIIETRGRPALPGLDVSVKLTTAAMTIVEAGEQLLARCTGKAPSRAAWVRYLIDDASRSSPFGRISPAEFREAWPDDTHLVTPHLITIRITEHQQILVRQWEFAIQQLDWTRHLYRNEALSFLIEWFGPTTNRILEMQIAMQNRQRPD